MVDKILGHYEKSIPSLNKHCHGVSSRLEHAFERMLAKKPEERFQSMTEVIAELEACRAAEPLFGCEGDCRGGKPGDRPANRRTNEGGRSGIAARAQGAPPVP